jgi:hypothetical protein
LGNKFALAATPLAQQIIKEMFQAPKAHKVAELNVPGIAGGWLSISIGLPP